MGKDVARDCFPEMLVFIRRHGAPAAAPAAEQQWAVA